MVLLKRLFNLPFTGYNGALFWLAVGMYTKEKFERYSDSIGSRNILISKLYNGSNY